MSTLFYYFIDAYSVLNFKSRQLKNFCENNQVKQIFATPYHPQTCGIVERINGSIIEKLRVELKENMHKNKD